MGSFYGFGWKPELRALQVSHSGAFARGAATAVNMYPVDQLAVIVLTNAAPVGVAEAISAEFVDFIRYGVSKQNWLEVIGLFFEEEPTADQIKYTKPAATAKPGRTLSSYVGTYQNAAYGPLVVRRITSLTVNAWNHEKLGTFTRRQGG